ncbi:polyketide cyclase, partial [Acinetobacter baumannii]
MNKQEMKDLVTKAHHELFNLHDTTAQDRYSSEDFI